MTATSIDDQLTSELPWLRRLAHRLAKGDADDLVQETWLLARRDAAGRRHGGLRRWLGQVMWHRWASIRRADIARSRREQLAPAASAEPHPEHRAIEGDVVRILDEALAALSDDDRALLRDRFFDGRSAAEIARELGVRPVTVRSRIHRCLGRLRRVLDERYGSDRSAWAPAIVALHLRRTAVATATKALFTVGVVTAAAALGWTLVGDGDAGDDIVPATVAPSDEPTLAADAPVSPDTSAQRMVGENLQSARHHWSERLGAIEAARRKRPGAGAPGGGEPEVLPSAVPPPTDLIPQLAQLGCVDLLPDHPRGRFQVRLHYIGEPDVGTVVESVDILEDTLDAPEFSECWSNSLYLLELGAPEVPVRGAYDLAYNAGDGARVDRALGEIKTFVREHPKYAEEHEELARLLELPDDTPANQWMPEYVEVLGRDPELDSALDALGKPASP